jgi:hypothetical protein
MNHGDDQYDHLYRWGAGWPDAFVKKSPKI